MNPNEIDLHLKPRVIPDPRQRLERIQACYQKLILAIHDDPGTTLEVAAAIAMTVAYVEKSTSFPPNTMDSFIHQARTDTPGDAAISNQKN